MARPTRLDYPGAWHHVMNRGARQEPIFRDADDCQAFLDGVAEAVERYRIEVHAYALMPNHYHLLVRSPHATLSSAMKRVGARHTAWLNARHGWDGPVFRGRFHNRVVTRDEHLVWLLAYIHLNPLRARLTRSLSAEAWTSHRAYLGLDRRPPSWLHLDEMLGRFEGPTGLERFVRDAHLGRQRFPDDLQLGRWSAQPERPEEILRGRKPPSRERVRPADVETVLRTVCRLTKAKRKSLLQRERGRGANPARRFAVWALVRSTPLTNAEVGRILDMTADQIHNLLSRMRRSDSEPVATWRKAWLESVEPTLHEK